MMLPIVFRLTPLLFLAVALLAGCGDNAAPSLTGAPVSDSNAPGVSPNGVEPSQQSPLTVTDGLGRSVTLTSPPERIVSLAPKNTELLFAVGAAEQIVGTTTYCNYPSAASRLPKVGGFSSNSINMERIVSRKPDLVVAAGNIHAPVIEHLERLGIPTLALAAESLGALYDEIELLGRVTGHRQTAARRIQQMKERVESVRRRTQDVPPEQRPTVYYQVWDQPLSAAGPASFIGELIEFAGGENIVTDRSASYTPISEEVVLDRDPDVILTAPMQSAPVRVEQFSQKRGWSDIRAVRNGRVHCIDGDLVSRCGPRLVDALEIIARLLYPRRFAQQNRTPGRPVQQTDRGAG